MHTPKSELRTTAVAVRRASCPQLFKHWNALPQPGKGCTVCLDGTFSFYSHLEKGLRIAARGLQGVGGALLVPGSLALISASFPSEERGRAIGTWSGFTAITAAVGPVLGGWLIQHASWRSVLFLNVPIAAVVLGLTFFRVPESRNEEQMLPLDLFRSRDFTGANLLTLFLYTGLSGVFFFFPLNLIQVQDTPLPKPARHFCRSSC
jgi:MFS family permease